MHGHDGDASGELAGGAAQLHGSDNPGRADGLAVHAAILVGLSGFLVVDKPRGWTSHDVVAKLRNASKGARIGHAGTLDPMATGVLVICFGAATRLVEWATADDKRYLAEVTLGVETDTYDADGALVAERPVAVDRAAIERALDGLRGAIEQVPPAYSAIKVAGQRSYDRARRGQDVAVEPRRVTVHRLDLLRFELPRLQLDVLCSKGTYVRSLAHDLGEQLGCGAHLSALRRTDSGGFALAEARPLDDALAMLASGRGVELMLPLERAVASLPIVTLDDSLSTRLRQGQPVNAEPALSDGAVARAYGPDDALLAIVDRRGQTWWPRKVFST
jgi:tRNA pseudouridine55 synthase